MSRRYDYDRYDEDPLPRSKSKTERFLSALDRGHFRDAVDAVRPSGGGGGGGDSRSHANDRYRNDRENYSNRHSNRNYYDSPASDDDYYHQSHARRSTRDTPRGANHDYYYPEGHGRSSGRGRTSYADSYGSDERRPRGRSANYHARDRYDDYSSYSSDSDRDRNRGRGRQSRSRRAPPPTTTTSSSRRQSQSVGPNWTQAGKAALMAGAVEGWKSRNRPGKVKRIATAAVGAAAMDAFVAKDKGKDEKSKRHITQSTIGGLMLDRILNGSAKR